MRLSRAPPLRTLRAFCLCARHLSFKAAADELCVTASAVSHQMRELEAALGSALFERKTRMLALTPAGKRLLEEVEPILEALDRSLTQLARHGTRATLRVRLPALFASSLFIPALPSFLQAHEGVDLQLEAHDPPPMIHPPTADVSILLVESPPDDLHSAHLFPLSFTAACAPEHVPRVARLGREVFGALALIVHQRRPDDWASWAEQAGLDPPEANSVIGLDTLSAVVHAAELGLGIALAPNILCEPSVRSGALMRVFSVQLMTRESYFVACRQKDAEKAHVKALFQWTVRQFQQAHGTQSPLPLEVSTLHA